MSFFDGSRGGTNPSWFNDLFDDTARLKSVSHGEPERLALHPPANHDAGPAGLSQ